MTKLKSRFLHSTLMKAGFHSVSNRFCPIPGNNLDEKYPGRHDNEEGHQEGYQFSGAFIELEEGIDAFLHIDDYSWTRKIKNASSVLKEGEEIEAVVIAIEPDTKRVRLGVKQLSDDPMGRTQEVISLKAVVVEGEITNVTDFGIFVRVPGGIEGLVNKFNLKLKQVLKE